MQLEKEPRSVSLLKESNAKLALKVFAWAYGG